jgi:ADP-ribose pyrophosphatase
VSAGDDSPLGALPPTQLLPFEEVARGEPLRRAVFAYRQDTVRSPTSGKSFRVDRLLLPDWVNVVAFDEDDHLILVRQWRFGSSAFSVEVPAGLLEPGEDPIAGALRELREETGHTPLPGVTPVVIGATRPNAAFQNNRCTTILVPRCRRTHPQELDPGEEVEVLRLPRASIDALLRAGAGACAQGPVGAQVTVGTDCVDNALVFVALQLWRLHVSPSDPASL